MENSSKWNSDTRSPVCTVGGERQSGVVDSLGPLEVTISLLGFLLS